MPKVYERKSTQKSFKIIFSFPCLNWPPYGLTWLWAKGRTWTVYG